MRLAHDLAVKLLTSYEGSAVLSGALGQPELMARQARRLERLLPGGLSDGLVPTSAACADGGPVPSVCRSEVKGPLLGSQVIASGSRRATQGLPEVGETLSTCLSEPWS